jgi:shikimate dehydrogenase
MNAVPIDGRTTICAVIGNPIEHSLSPAIHNAAFAARGINGAYVAFNVTQLKKAIEGIRGLGIRGVSVTIPHKIAVMPLLDTIDETARTIGSINTIVNTGGHLAGYNSDGIGALQALRDAGCNPTGKRVTILGSGGAARAIAVTMSLQAPPAALTLLGIIPEELALLSSDIAATGALKPALGVLSAEGLNAALQHCDLLVNATPVGMYPKTDESLIPRDLLLKQPAVFDIVYNPRKTKLLGDALQAGCTVVSGIEMFLNQAAVQFTLWTGQPAPVEVMRAVLDKHFT